MTGLPPELLAARTPAEWKRHQMIDRLWIGTLISFGCLFVLLLIIWLGRWSDRVEEQRLSILGWLCAAFVAREMLGGLANSVGGPVGRWKARWGDRELDVSSKLEDLKQAVENAPALVADQVADQVTSAVYDGAPVPVEVVR